MTNEKIIAVYNKKLASLNISFKEKKIKTSFGKTNILIFGDEKKPVLFLLHGINSAAPFAFDTLSFLIDKYQILAIDILGEPNKSDFVRLNKKDTSYGKWLLEITNYFNFNDITLCGISFGAFPILKSLLINNKNVIEVFLISPAGLINGSLWKTIYYFLIPLKKYQKTKKEKYLIRVLSSFSDDVQELNISFYREIFLNFNIDYSLTPNFKRKEILKLNTPITIITSNNDYFVPGKKLQKTYNFEKTLVKNIILLEDSKHIPSKLILKNYLLNR